jgi:chromosome segregation ATPase
VSQEKGRLEELITKLKQERDELRVQIHLAKAEAKDEWEELERKWEVVENKLAALKRETKDASKDIGAALGVLSEEIANAYKRIRKKLN